MPLLQWQTGALAPPSSPLPASATRQQHRLAQAVGHEGTASHGGGRGRARLCADSDAPTRIPRYDYAHLASVKRQYTTCHQDKRRPEVYAPRSILIPSMWCHCGLSSVCVGCQSSMRPYVGWCLDSYSHTWTSSISPSRYRSTQRQGLE